MSKQEAAALVLSDRIRPLGSSGKVWQLTEDSFARPNWESGDGRISLEVDGRVQALLASEMRRRPSWCITTQGSDSVQEPVASEIRRQPSWCVTI